ncbi:PorT family protein [Candidatus Sulfidibacterium hydrothermale]|uniref:porin family protein n=1 Tax=Candidatus Sulfidibacterium hydrothermale TaxID=2875962 RepID=UPI001F0B4AF5|nr:porin family protein [Candidatus Sulfidibacterium hydrothermale]UBM61154.1 PorT family protein [Candidatus Sulfidibacterium hydrothermale]
MKKIFLLGFAIFLSFSLFAQSTFRNRLSFGVELGPSFSSVRDAGLSNSEGRTAVNGGIFAQYDISNTLKVSLGLNYDPRGFSTSYQSPYLILSDTGYIGYNSYYAYDMTYTIDYITLPLNLTYLSGGDKWRLLVEGGVYLSVAVTSRVKGFSGTYIDPDDLPYYGDSTLTSGYHMTHYDTSASDFFNPTDVGFHFAFGVIYHPTAQWAITFKPGFNFGVSAIVSNPDIDMKWDRILKINVGVIYKIHPFVKPKNEYILQ